MNKFNQIVIVLLLLLFAGVAYAVAPVNIVYPIHGASYPVGGGEATGGAELIEFSFSTTCPSGAHSVRWGIDGFATALGSAKFYDQYTTQQTYKVAAGWHSFEVISSCGQDAVKFYVDH